MIPNSWNIFDLLKLTFYKGVNDNLIKRVVEDFASYDEFLNSKLPGSLAIKFRQEALFSKGDEHNIDAEKQLELIEKHQIKYTTIWDDEYPALLKQISYPPVILFYRGTLQNSNAAAVAVVGTRQYTGYGKITTELFTSHFARNNVVVVSGLARGIDTLAHMETVKNGGITYAVIASGIDKISPLSTKSNAEKIIDSGGAVISHFKCGKSALPPFFLQRNRIIAGIAKATLVVESGAIGGSLNTARHAFQESRELFAIPGRITSEKSHGTNSLIKENKAQLAVSPEQILEEIGIDNQNYSILESQEKPKLQNKSEEKIYNILSLEPIHIDDIPEKTDLDISEILVRLLEMEFKGIVKQLPGKYYIKAK